MHDEQMTEWVINQNKERQDREYWIDRTGKIHKYQGDLKNIIPSFHGEIASQLYPNSNNPGDILSNLGWVMVGSVAYSRPVIHRKPTQSQINKLVQLDLYERLFYKI